MRWLWRGDRDAGAVPDGAEVAGSPLALTVAETGLSLCLLGILAALAIRVRRRGAAVRGRRAEPRWLGHGAGGAADLGVLFWRCLRADHAAQRGQHLSRR